jgi:putative photosynthetic complex assembly protein
MTRLVSDDSFPRLPLIGAGLLVAFTIGSIATMRLTGAGASPEVAAPARIVRDLRFEDRPDGAVAVFDASDNAQFAELGQGEDGFVRGVLRSFARERRINEAAITSARAGAPFRLSLMTDGQLTIQDMATGRLLVLNAFGSTNSGAFAALLNARPAAALPAAHVTASKEVAP